MTIRWIFGRPAAARGAESPFPAPEGAFSVGAGADQFDYGALPADLP